MDNFKFKRYVIAGFGNPLLDISVNIQDSSILEKYNLKIDGQKEVNNDEFTSIITTLNSEKYEMTENPGGCVQNTLRILQTLVKHPSFCVFFGGLGNDKEGELVELEVKKSGVETRYAKHSDYPTGKVAALINGENRSLVAHLGAADFYRPEDFVTVDNIRIIKEAFIVYIEGFFITHSFEVAMNVISLCKTFGMVFVFNISGVYVAEMHSEKLLTTVTFADIVIGNAAEFKALANVMGLETSSTEDIALKVHKYLCERNKCDSTRFKLSQMDRLGKTVVITQGKDPVFCVSVDKNLIKLEVPLLDLKLFKDATGAGDSFVAGFLLGFLQDKPVTDCLAYGCLIAQKIIQCTGVWLPDEELI